MNSNHVVGKKIKTREKLLDEVRVFFFMQGYAISIKHYKKDKYVVIGCNRRGAYLDRHNAPIDYRRVHRLHAL